MFEFTQLRLPQQRGNRIKNSGIWTTFPKARRSNSHEQSLCNSRTLNYIHISTQITWSNITVNCALMDGSCLVSYVNKSAPLMDGAVVQLLCEFFPTSFFIHKSSTFLCAFL